GKGPGLAGTFILCRSDPQSDFRKVSPLPSKFDSAAGEVPLPGVPGHLSASSEAGKILGKKWQFSFRSIIIESSILFDGGRTMGIRIEIDAAPAYELYPSLLAYLGKDKSLDRGPSWARQVR